ncbi:hypothetical protein ACEPAH_7895 [Sanghuangporus vaninii]
MIASTLLVLAAANVARAQVSTASLFPVGFMDDGLSGEAVGTGVDGTTFVLSATFDELSVPYTMTLVQDETHVSITAALETAGITVPIDVQCAMGGGEAVCRQVVGSGIDATTITESGAVLLTGVPVGEGAAGSVTVTGTATGTSRLITFSSSTPTDTDVLPPIISNTRTATLTDSTATTTGTDAAGNPGLTSGDVSSKDEFMIALGFAVPALISAALLNTF